MNIPNENEITASLAAASEENSKLTVPQLATLDQKIHEERAIWEREEAAAEKILSQIFHAPDRNVESVRAKLSERAATGLRKYGVTTERSDLSRKQWLIHAQEEALDLAVYLERLIQEEREGRS